VSAIGTGILGVPVASHTFESAVELLQEFIVGKTPRFCVLANANTLSIACENPDYRDVLLKADLILRDGVGSAYAMRLLGQDPKCNFAGTYFIPDFAKRTSDYAYRYYLLGSQEGVAVQAAENLKRQAPGIVVAGCDHGYFDLGESDAMVARINESECHVLLVGMGNPHQEMWIASNLDRLEVPLSIGVGGLFDILSGRVGVTPQPIRNVGLEWLFRVIREPKRLWRRYLIGNVKFVFRVRREAKQAAKGVGRE
jgi:N-acetylglucosaminyldiphosphoundecaprenol N-acetyl-beta-D-mannosaminyltransferase